MKKQNSTSKQIKPHNGDKSDSGSMRRRVMCLGWVSAWTAGNPQPARSRRQQRCACAQRGGGGGGGLDKRMCYYNRQLRVISVICRLADNVEQHQIRVNMKKKEGYEYSRRENQYLTIEESFVVSIGNGKTLDRSKYRKGRFKSQRRKRGGGGTLQDNFKPSTRYIPFNLIAYLLRKPIQDTNT